MECADLARSIGSFAARDQKLCDWNMPIPFHKCSKPLRETQISRAAAPGRGWEIVGNQRGGFRKNGGTEKVTVDDHSTWVPSRINDATVRAMLSSGRKFLDDDHWRNLSELKSEIHPDYLGVTWNSFCLNAARPAIPSRFMA